MAPYREGSTPATDKKGTRRRKPAGDGAQPRMVTYGAVKLADLLVPHLKDRYRYCPQLGWLNYTGAKWEETTDEVVLHEVVQVVKQHAAAIVNNGLLSAETARELAKFSEGNTQTHAVKLAKGHPEVATRWELFDARPVKQLGQPYRVHSANGFTIELFPDGRTDVRATTPGDLNTKTACAYDPTAPAPLAAKWWSTYQPDQDVWRFQVEMAARALSGMGAQQFCAWYGEKGGNGKSTIETLLTRVAGDYALKLPVEVILAKSRSARQEFRNELAQLRAARLVFADEPEAGSRYNAGVIKSLTGGAPIDARENFRAPITFVPHIVLTLISNNRPSWDTTDGGMDRRYVEIEWGYQTPEEARREAFMEELAEEAPGVLNWLIKHWPGETPVVIPDAIKKQTEEAKRQSNPVTRFVDEAIEPNEGGRAKSTDMYLGYVEWCRQNGERPYSSTRFGTSMGKLGYEKIRSNGIWYENVQVGEDYWVSSRL